MGHGTSKPPLAQSDKSADNLLVVFATVGSTTWRMFVPVILGALAGYWVDGQYGTKYGAITGAIIGLVFAGLLVWRQYVDATKPDDTEKKS